MKNQKSNTKKFLVAGTIIAGSVLSFSTATANLYEINELGSAGELRVKLLENVKSPFVTGELKCGEASCGEADKKKSKKDKTTEAKCGEGKCGEADKAVEASCGEADKTVEAKCGEGKCGEADTKKVEDKATEAKCGEGKCGEASCGEK